MYPHLFTLKILAGFAPKQDPGDINGGGINEPPVFDYHIIIKSSGIVFLYMKSTPIIFTPSIVGG